MNIKIKLKKQLKLNNFILNNMKNIFNINKK